MIVVATVVVVQKDFIELNYRGFGTGKLLTIEVEINEQTKNWAVDDLIVFKMKLMAY